MGAISDSEEEFEEEREAAEEEDEVDGEAEADDGEERDGEGDEGEEDGEQPEGEEGEELEEAEEAEEDEEGEGEEDASERGGHAGIEEEAEDEEEEPARADEPDDEEDEEGQDEYEEDGFLVDGDEEEEGGDDEEEEKRSDEEEVRHKKKKRKKRELELDEDDYELLQENVHGFHRPRKPAKEQKRLKRLKKAGKPQREERRRAAELEDEDEEEHGGIGTGRTAEEELKRSLFGDDEVHEEEEIPEEEEVESEVSDDDEFGDFIDDATGHSRKRKPKKHGEARAFAGLSSNALREAHDIFGDVSDLLERRRRREEQIAREDEDDVLEEDGYGRGLPGSRNLKAVAKQFEPSLLEAKFLTDRDAKIRNRDAPERMQILEETIGPVPDPESFQKEAEWIYDRAFGSSSGSSSPLFAKINAASKAEIVQQIVDVLTQLHEEKFEVPFIGLHRQELCLGLLPDEELEDDDERENKGGRLKKYEALWEIHHWDKKWRVLQRRKSSLQKMYEARMYQESDSDKVEALEKIMQAMMDAQSEVALDDVDCKFKLHFPIEETVEQPVSKYKQPKRKSRYQICVRAGLGAVVKHFGLSAEELGENMQAMYKRNEPEDDQRTPEELAADYLSTDFPAASSVLSGARLMAVVEVSAEPAVREYFRSLFAEKAVVSTKPTAVGMSAIDQSHRYYRVKYLLNKPVNLFDDAQWCLIQQAEADKLLEVTVGMPKEAVDTSIIQELENLYLSDGVSRSAQLWNEQRRMILRAVVNDHLLPSMEKEMRVTLAARSRQWIMKQVAENVWKTVGMAPFRPKTDYDEEPEEEVPPPRVMACCWGPGKPATTFVMLDVNGDIVDILHCGFLSSRVPGPAVQERKKMDRERLVNFILEQQPQMIVVGAANMSCRRLKEDISEVIFKIVDEQPRGLEAADIPVVFADEGLASLFEKSQAAADILPGQLPIVRRAVGLGRLAQNPLALVALLCGTGKEVLSYNWYPAQDLISSDELMEAIEQVMVTVTSQVGIDINMAVAHEWQGGCLQFAPGLGPRKATYLLQGVSREGRLTCRKDLLDFVSNEPGARPFVFFNCASTIRVRSSGMAASVNQFVDPLEDTRIHPLSYPLATKLAEHVWLLDRGLTRDEAEEIEAELDLAVNDVRENPTLLSGVDVEEFANSLMESGEGRKIQTLALIKAELMNGYADWRAPYEPPSQETEFFMLTGETDQTIAVGKLVQATVRKVQNNRVICALESGITGLIAKEDLSDDPDVDPTAKVSEGSIITCRIKNVLMPKYLVDLTCKGSDLRSERWNDLVSKDPYAVRDESLAIVDAEKAKKKREQQRKSLKPRMIVHPLFKNLSMDEASEALADKDVGEVIIRPSSKGPTHLSLTLKFFEGLYTHIDIKEGGKDIRDPVSFFRLGKTLSIGDETYEDLDEVVARYVEPLVTKIRDMLKYRKFKRGTKVEVDDQLKQEKMEKPGVIPYYVSVSYEHPGAFILSYIRNVNPHHEYISVSPKGYRYRKKDFKSPDALIGWFQRHFNDPITDLPARRAVAAMVPSQSTPNSIGYGGTPKHQWGGNSGRTPEWSGNGNAAAIQGPTRSPSQEPWGSVSENSTDNGGSSSWATLPPAPISPPRNYDAWSSGGGSSTPVSQRTTEPSSVVEAEANRWGANENGTSWASGWGSQRVGAAGVSGAGGPLKDDQGGMQSGGGWGSGMQGGGGDGRNGWGSGTGEGVDGGGGDGDGWGSAPHAGGRSDSGKNGSWGSGGGSNRGPGGQVNGGSWGGNRGGWNRTNGGNGGSWDYGRNENRGYDNRSWGGGGGGGRGSWDDGPRRMPYNRGRGRGWGSGQLDRGSGRGRWGSGDSYSRGASGDGWSFGGRGRGPGRGGRGGWGSGGGDRAPSHHAREGGWGSVKDNNGGGWGSRGSGGEGGEDGGSWGVSANNSRPPPPASEESSPGWAPSPGPPKGTAGGWGPDSTPKDNSPGWAPSPGPSKGAEGGWAPDTTPKENSPRWAPSPGPSKGTGGGWGADATPKGQSGGGWGADATPKGQSGGGWASGSKAPENNETPAAWGSPNAGKVSEGGDGWGSGARAMETDETAAGWGTLSAKVGGNEDNTSWGSASTPARVAS
ncbi:hypothetical protein CBR_g879 [Chara braunii]|uniref:S1 motif domain-containing protein n=1 Tax=Chara braunii TaxID=69332 RepID=A0A388KCS7_CHABU|nr:hypothetical protein CBR_g879 [Chara braunii]|eukprot:GBG67753.1 hypothetical protein CBR_g879 [Chara braunii]